MEVTVYTECPDKNYYRSPMYHKNIELNFIDSRFFRSVFVKVFRNEGSFKEIWKSFIAPVSLLFKKDIVVAFAPYHREIYYLLLLKLLKKNLVYFTSWHDWEKDCVHKSLLFEKNLWRRFLKGTKTITISKKSKEEVERFGAKAVQIPHSVDFELFKDFGDERKNRVLYVGRLTEEKGIRDLLELSKELKDIEFVFVGSGPMEEEIKKYPVKFKGRIDDRNELVKEYNKADIFVLNSYKTNNWEELYGIVLLEAMACGLPVIATDCVGPREIINGNNGILIPQKNKGELKKAILKLSSDKTLKEEYRKEGKEFVNENYNVEVLSKKWYEMIMQKTFK